MSGASLRINVKYDDRKVRAGLKRLARAGGNLTDAFAEIGEHLTESTRNRFDQGVDPEGNQWEPLAAKTVVRKKKNADKILLESGGLMDSLHYNASSHQLEFGTNLIYGATHQFGREDAGIPARPFLGISTDDEHEILNIIEDHIRSALK